MRKFTGSIVAGFFVTAFLIALVANAQAKSSSRKRHRPEQADKQIGRQADKQSATIETLMEMMRRVEQAAETAQAEARRAREQTEALRLQLAQATKEIADYGLRIADLKNEVARMQPAAGNTVASRENVLISNPPSEPLTDNRPAQTRQSTLGSPQSAIRSPQSEDRLAALEDQVEINSAQLKEHAQTKVESDSRFRVRLTGMILFNAFVNTADSSTRTAPTRSLPPADSRNLPSRNFGTNLRQTTIGLAMEGPRVGGARLSAEADFDFYGTTGDTFSGSALGILRLRTASTRLDWQRTALTVGLRPAMISPLNPSSLASVWYPSLSRAGNLWQWRPQIILEHRPQIGESSELILQGGLLTPFFDTLDSTAIEGGLNYQGRVAFRHNFDTEKKLEFGVGGQAGNRAFVGKRREMTYVISSDWQIPLGSRLELSGEAYFSKANNLGEQSGTRADNYYALSGPISDPTTTIRGIHAFGGWGQLNFKARRDLDFNFAFGLEDPRNRDVLSGRRNPANNFKNQVVMTNFIYQLRSNLLLSLEYRRLWTTYATGKGRNDHYNFGIGYLF